MGEGTKKPIGAIAILALVTKKLALAAGLLVLLAPVVTGCGGGGDNGESGDSSSSGGSAASIEEFGSEARGAKAKQAEAALHRHLDARSVGQWQKACSALSKETRRLLAGFARKSKRVEGDDCAAGLASVTEDLSPQERADLAKVEVESVRVEDDRGYVIYQSADARYAISASLEDGRWGFSASAVSLE